jgi:hypothetical protein
MITLVGPAHTGNSNQITAPRLRPGSSWNGTAGTGFVLFPAPTDPTRTTAKPAMRLLVPPNQYFTDELLVGVLAGANYQQSLSANMGLQCVIAHYEGNSVVIGSPSWRSFPDANGVMCTYFGFWAILKRDGRNGHANVYFEAVPRDGTMQKRVIGPFQYSPQATLYDYDLTVAPTPAEVAGSHYKTPLAAMNYLRGVSAQNPRITFTETANYTTWNSGSGYTGNGYCNFEAAPGVTATITQLDSGGVNPGYNSTQQNRTRWNGMHFKGEGIVFDMRYLGAWFAEVGTVRQHWLDGVRFTNSGGGNELWQKRARPYPGLVREYAYFTECYIEYLSNPLRSATLVRGCVCYKTFDDQASGTACVVGTEFRDVDSEWLKVEIAALTVQYTGAGATATIEISGSPGSNNRVVNCKVDGSSVGTFTVLNTEAGFLAGTNYDVSDVVAFINGLADWTASTTDDTRAAVWLGKTGFTSNQAITATDVKTAPLTLYTRLFPHTDLYASTSVVAENTIIAFNTSNAYDLQIIMGGGYVLKDWLIINNGFQTTIQTWQINYQSSHFVVAHNSTTYELNLRVTQGFTADSYCLYANNAMKAMGVESGADYGSLIRNNHTTTAAPLNAVGHTVGGTTTSLFVDATTRDFTPAGELLINLKAPVARFDRGRRIRAVLDAAGATAIT